MPALYLISPPHIEASLFYNIMQEVFQSMPLVQGYFQLRLKTASDTEISVAIEVLQPLCRQYNVKFILNDAPHLAKQYACDGLHLGKDDMSVQEARALIGADIMIGASCYNSIDMALNNIEQGADYVAFGAMYPTLTKQSATPAEIGVVKRYKGHYSKPCVAIGGITVDNVQPIIDSGADFIAVSSGVWNHPDGAVEAVKQFSKVLNP